MTYRIFISTGEVSGDLQGAMLIDALKRQAQARNLELEILALGGDRMQAAGATLLSHTSAIGSIGLLESLPYVLPTLKVQKQAKVYLERQPPDLVILIDYMSPNVAFCNYLVKHLPTVPVVYYIAPQEWAWSITAYNTNRIIQATDRILSIFPAEAEYYRQQGGNVTWVGHPLVDRMAQAPSRQQARAALGLEPDQLAIALLPASRQQELKYLLPIVFGAAQQIQAKLPQVQFWIPLALEKYRATLTAAIAEYELQATLVADSLPSPAHSTTLQVLAAADLAITKSGTVNLELALLDIPQVVLYKVNAATATILRWLNFSLPYVSPPNLVAKKSIVREFLQDQATPSAIAQESLELLLNLDRRQAMLADYADLRQSLGEVGVCDRAAQEIFDLLAQRSSLT